MDFAAIGHGGEIMACPQCGLMANLDAPLLRSGAQAILSDAYLDSGQTCQMQHDRRHSGPVSIQTLQAEWLREKIPVPPRRILDVGCYDGRLLGELKRLWPDGDCHGFDIHAGLRSCLPEGVRFWHKHLDDIPGSFDLICLSHSLIYLPDLLPTLERLHRLCAVGGGTLFFHGTNIESNPAILALGDQAWYFCRRTLPGVFARAGFVFVPGDEPRFPRDVVGLASRGEGSVSATCSSSSAGLAPKILADALSRLYVLKENLTAIPGGEVFVLGTTSTAAFADGILQRRNVAFVDEHRAAPGDRFRGKPVLHPQQLGDFDRLVIPYGSAAGAIAERFAGLYAGEFLAM
ncbi:MAG: methyltransferase domain-containing protein [Magnetococcales bacterium]|nr:methyltransferase domain-containing protein [Magnetococcales bacterium]